MRRLDAFALGAALIALALWATASGFLPMLPDPVAGNVFPFEPESSGSLAALGGVFAALAVGLFVAARWSAAPAAAPARHFPQGALVHHPVHGAGVVLAGGELALVRFYAEGQSRRVEWGSLDAAGLRRPRTASSK